MRKLREQAQVGSRRILDVDDIRADLDTIPSKVSLSRLTSAIMGSTKFGAIAT